MSSSALDILERLVSFRSVSHCPNLDIADYIAFLAKAAGGEVRRFPSVNFQKESLLLSWGEPKAGGVVLSGHMDVVPVDNQAWASDPFKLRRADHMLFARGAVDMKSFLAIAVSVATSIDASKLSAPLHLALSYDEEVSCEGVKPLAAFLRDSVPTPAVVIVGEPTELRTVVAHKGAVDWRVLVRGRAAHSSLPQLGTNAIHAAARFVCEVDRLSQKFIGTPRESSAPFDIPYPTLSVGLIGGGTAGNIIASSCQLHLEARTIFAEDDWGIRDHLSRFAKSELLPSMREVAPEADISIEELARIPPLVRHEDSAAELLVTQAMESRSVEAVSYATEAGFFQSAGIATVVCGPGSIKQAHQPNEFITIDQFEKGQRFISQIVKNLS